MARPGALASLALALCACAQPMQPAASPTSAPTQATKQAQEVARARLQASLDTWNGLRDAVRPGYHYQVVVETHTGHRSVTTVVVRDHRVVERRFEAPGMQWVETQNSLGTHTEGAAPLTLDALYARAGHVIHLSLHPEQALSLGIDNRGLLHHCYIQDRRIMDGSPMTGVPPMALTLSP